MKFLYLINRLKLHIRADGLKHAMKSVLYYNRLMVIIEKELKYIPYEKKDLAYVIIDDTNYKSIQNRFNLRIFGFYANKNVKTLLAIKNNKIVGFIRWTQDNNFGDLKKFKIKIQPDEVYLFDLFIYPEYRGSDVLQWITYKTFNHLLSIGVKKFYGFYFSDNIQALWWHRAIMKAREINKHKSHRAIIFEFIDGKFFL